MENTKRTELIEKILDKELKMFLTVPVRQKAACQEHPESFKTMRRAQFLMWSEKTLESYLKDLEMAEKEGRNLMTEKYARMDNLIPPKNQDPLIDKIVNIQCKWQEEMFRKYPKLMRGARPVYSSQDSPFQTSFETYLRGELETYSHNTLASLYDDIVGMQKEGKNMAEELYKQLVMDLGYESLEEAEEAAKNRH
ncbi:DUF4125 family protein [Desulfothermus naphthae]